MKAILVDGPAHGDPMPFEGEPPRPLYVPGMKASSRKITAADDLPTGLDHLMPTHEYVPIGKSPQGTEIYVYLGQK
jgi:hypothetical protein